MLTRAGRSIGVFSQGKPTLAGDYSPRTERILPEASVRSKPKLVPFGPINPKALTFAQGGARPQVLLDQRRVFEKTVGHQAQFAFVFQVFYRLAQQMFGGLVMGVHAFV